MSEPFCDRRVKGDIGTGVTDRLYREREYVLYSPEPDRAHPFDRLVAAPDKRSIFIGETKTKTRRRVYADTGINQAHFDDYNHITTSYGLPLFLAFVDPPFGTVYGNYWSELLKPCTHDGHAYPWAHKGIVYFPLVVMQPVGELTPEEKTTLLALARSQFHEASTEVRAHRVEHPTFAEFTKGGRT